jgi:hypothetical protein
MGSISDCALILPFFSKERRQIFLTPLFSRRRVGREIILAFSRDRECFGVSWELSFARTATQLYTLNSTI